MVLYYVFYLAAAWNIIVNKKTAVQSEVNCRFLFIRLSLEGRAFFCSCPLDLSS